METLKFQLQWLISNPTTTSNTDRSSTPLAGENIHVNCADWVSEFLNLHPSKTKDLLVKPKQTESSVVSHTEIPYFNIVVRCQRATNMK